jgi:hypothetical protein
MEEWNTGIGKWNTGIGEWNTEIGGWNTGIGEWNTGMVASTSFDRVLTGKQHAALGKKVLLLLRWLFPLRSMTVS